MSDITRINLSSLQNDGSITGRNQLGSTKQAKSANTVDYTDGLSNKDLKQLDENKDGYIDEQEFRTAMEKSGKGNQASALWTQYLGAFNTKVNNASNSITSDASKLAMVQMFSKDGGSKIHPAIIQEFVNSLVTAMGNNDFPKSGVHDLIHNGFKAICESKNIQVTTEDLNVCEELLNNFIEKNGSTHGNDKYITALDMQKAIKTHAESNINQKSGVTDALATFKKENDAQAKDLQNFKPQFKELLTLTGETNLPEDILNALVDALAAYLPSNTVDLNNLDNLIDNLFAGYLDALNPPIAHTETDLKNVKSMLKKFADAFANNDKDKTSLSANDVSQALRLGAKVELSSTLLAGAIKDVEGGSELSPELLTALTDKVIIANILSKDFINNDFMLTALCNTALSDFSKEDREKAVQVLKNFITTHGNKDGDSSSLSLKDVNKVVRDTAEAMLQGSKNTITQLIDDSKAGLSSNISNALADAVIAWLPEHIIMENQVDSLIDNEFNNYLKSLNPPINATAEDLAAAKKALRYLITNNPRYNSETGTGLHWEGMLAEGAVKNFTNKMESQAPLLNNLLTENGKANIKPSISSALTNFITESISKGDIDTSDIAKLINTDFKQYLEDNNIPYTSSDLSNAKTVFTKFVSNFENDGYKGSISDRDISNALATKQDISENLTTLGSVKSDTIGALSQLAEDKISSEVLNKVYDALLIELSGDKTLSKNQITKFFNKYLSGLSFEDKAQVRAMLEKLIDICENNDKEKGLSIKDLAKGAKDYSDAVQTNIDSLKDIRTNTLIGFSAFAEDKLDFNILNKVYDSIVYTLSTGRTFTTEQIDDFISNLGITLTDDEKATVKTMLEGLVNFSENLDGEKGLSLKDLQDVAKGHDDAIKNNQQELSKNKETMIDGLSLLAGDNLSSEILNRVYSDLTNYLSTGNGRTITNEIIDTYVNGLDISDTDKATVKSMLTSLVNGAENLDNEKGLSFKDFSDLKTWYVENQQNVRHPNTELQ